MSSTARYLAAIADELASLGYLDSPSPSQLVRQWRGFVDECADGYGWDISEYDNEIRVRRRLHALLSSSALQSYPQHRWLAQEVEQIDRRFQQLFQVGVARPHREHWWEQGILKYAGAPYASFVRQAYHIDVTVIG